MRFKLLALDVDGTLVGPDSIVPPDVVAAVAAADAAGVGICLATGRSFIETRGVWAQLRLSRPYQPMIVVGGALVTEPDTGRTLSQRAIERRLACEFSDALAEKGYCTMALVDSWRYGLEYVVTETGNIDEARERWFSQMDVPTRFVGRLAETDGPPELLRMSTVVDGGQAAGLAEAMNAAFGDRLNVHAILAPNYGVTIVEAFARRCSKLAGVRYVAQSRRTPPREIAAVGDDVNDLPLLEGVGLGVAMPDAPASLKEAADLVAAHGLAAFIHRLISGRFDTSPGSRPPRLLRRQ